MSSRAAQTGIATREERLTSLVQVGVHKTKVRGRSDVDVWYLALAPERVWGPSPSTRLGMTRLWILKQVHNLGTDNVVETSQWNQSGFGSRFRLEGGSETAAPW
jgi:hypothetical protein